MISVETFLSTLGVGYWSISSYDRKFLTEVVEGAYGGQVTLETVLDKSREFFKAVRLPRREFRKHEALKIAMYVHKGQKDLTGVSFIKHPLEVSVKLLKEGQSSTVVCAGLLHDALEESLIPSFIFRRVGVPHEIMSLVEKVSHIVDRKFIEEKLKDPAVDLRAAKSAEYYAYISSMQDDRDALLIKSKDLEHNLDAKRVKSLGRWYKTKVYAKSLEMINRFKLHHC